MTQEVRQVGPGAGGLPPAVQALAQADFSGVAQLFANAGFTVALPAPGMLQVVKPRADAGRASVAVSVGVHGDETGPIEVLAHLLDALSRDASELAVDLLGPVYRSLHQLGGRHLPGADEGGLVGGVEGSKIGHGPHPRSAQARRGRPTLRRPPPRGNEHG